MPYPWEGVPAGVPCWHIHHRVLLEWSCEPLDERAEYIQRGKPIREQGTRLRLMRPVKGKLPNEVAEAGLAELTTSRAYDTAIDLFRGEDYPARMRDDSREKAFHAWRKAEGNLAREIARHADAINALHRAECPDCPWDGTTIFPEEKP